MTISDTERGFDVGSDHIEKRDWLAEILLNATTDRKRINSIKLPGEPDYQEKPVRVDSGAFTSSVGNLLNRYTGKLESEKPRPEKKDEGWKASIEDRKPRAGMQRPHDYRV